MAPRAYWTGHIRLSLVTFPVRLYPATTTAHQVSFHQIHEPSGERIRYQKVVPEIGPVDPDQIVKGYEYERGRYVTLSEEEMADVGLETSRVIDIVQFVDVGEIDVVYYDTPHYLAPDGPLAEDAFLVIRDALRETRKVGLGQVVLRKKEHIAAIRPCGRGMVLESLRYEDELREAHDYFDEIPDRAVDRDQLELAKRLIESKTARFDPSRFVDHYQAALRELVNAKLEHREPQRAEEPRTGNVIDLMEALKRSLSQTGKAASKSKADTRPKAKTGARASKAGAGRSARKKTA